MAERLELAPSKIIAVHLNYRSRAEERGRMPAHPSYFLKPPSSVSGNGAPVVRPRGCELLAYEGEVAVVIGASARNVSPQDALGHIGSYTAANDFGVYDLRWADRGSNLRSKGQDGFTPLGPRLVPADELDPAAISLRTLVNGELAQEGSTSELLFSFAELIADLSRFLTLEPGDVILAGTPANSRPVQPGDEVTVEIDGIGRLTNQVVEAEHELARYGAMPRAGAGERAAALGTNAPRPVVLSGAAAAALRDVSTATLTVQLRRRGIANTFIGGLRPTRTDLRMLGYAHTLRYVALREDIRDADTAELNAQKHCIETVSPEDVVVMEARGERGAGTIGDILALRALRRGAAGIVTDGGLRDSPAVAKLELPTYYGGPHAAVLGLLHFPLEVDVPITCGGVLVMPGDVIVGDAEGVVVLPAALAEEVALEALAQEELEAWALERIDAGESVRGVYPISDARRPEYDAWRAARARDEEPR